MELAQEQEQAIENIIDKLDCPNNFHCYKSRFENLPEAAIWHGANLVECKQEGRLLCPNGAVLYDDVVFCKCPLRRYAAFQLQK